MYTLIFREIARLNEDELMEIKQMKFTDLSRKNELFCITMQEVEEYPHDYEAVLEFCEKVVTSDCVTLFVAKSGLCIYRSEEAIYKHFQQYSSELCAEYVDITKEAGSIIRLARGNDKFPPKEREWRVPTVPCESRLFYTVC